MATSSHRLMAVDLFTASIAAQDLARELGGTVETLRATGATAIPPSAGQAPLREYTVTVEVPDADPEPT
jgi:hypothetical protein